MKSVISGPSYVVGNLNPVQVMDPDVGPSMSFQGGHILDPRQIGGIEAAPQLPGYKVYGMWCSPYVTMVDGVPITKTTGLIAAAQKAASGTPFTLASAQASGLSIGIPVIPFGSAYFAANKVTPGVALDFGFTTGTSTSGSKSITSLPTGAWKFFKKNQRLVIAGAGGTNLPLFTTVAATPAAGATTLTINHAA